MSGYYHSSEFDAQLKEDVTAAQLAEAFQPLADYNAEKIDPAQLFAASEGLEVADGHITYDKETQQLSVRIYGEVSWGFDDIADEVYRNIGNLCCGAFEVTDTSERDGSHPFRHRYFGSNETSVKNLAFVCAVGRAAAELEEFCPGIRPVLEAQARLMRVK